MPIRIVQSQQNARLKQLRRALAQPGREPGDLAGIEGPNLLDESLRAGLRISTVFVAQGAESLLDALRLPSEIEILAFPREILATALATETPQPIAALVQPPDWSWAHILKISGNAPLVIVFTGLQDPGNLGTILRSAEAFGATGVVSLPGTVNAWNPKAVRASAGSVFRVPLLTANEDECLRELREAGVRILTTAASRSEASAEGWEGTGFSPHVKSRENGGALAPAGPQPAHLADLTGPVAILIGNEGNGVPADLAKKADGALTVPCPGPVESLNAAVAAGVLLYEASRQRSEAAESRRGANR